MFRRLITLADIPDYNDTDVPEVVHWHGQFVSSVVRGLEEEGTPLVPVHGGGTIR
jgi:hypothetical protein